MESPSTLRIGLAAVRNAPTVDDRLAITDMVMRQAANDGVAIVCFPETWLPGLRGMDFEVPPNDQARQESCLDSVRRMASNAGVAVILPMEWESVQGIHNLAFVISRDGTVEGYQAKNQIPPSEEPFYVAGSERRVFDVDGVTFGITICHEGWRYPEATRWAAVRGAQVVFHPHMTGSDLTGPTLTRWGDPGAPYYEKAMIARSAENSIYFASVNYAMRYQESATSLVDPEGDLVCHVPYGEEALLVHDVDLTRATRQYALRYRPKSFA
jgi:predicted amidohydrolase